MAVLCLTQAGLALWVLWASDFKLQTTNGVVHLSAIPPALSVLSLASNTRCRAACMWDEEHIAGCLSSCGQRTNLTMNKLGMGSVLELSLICEFVGLGLLFCLFRWWKHHVAEEHIKKLRERPCISDFSIMIPNLPKSIERKHLVRHFSALYPDNEPPSACCKASLVKHCRPLPEPHIRRKLANPDALTRSQHVIADDLHETAIASLFIHRTSPQQLQRAADVLQALGSSDDLQNGIAAMREAANNETHAYGCCAKRIRRARYSASPRQAADKLHGLVQKRVQSDSSRSTVFLTFTSTAIRKRCLEEFNSSGWARLCGGAGRLQLLQGDASHSLQVLPAPPVSEVHWAGTNTPYTRKASIRSILPCALVILGVILVAAVSGLVGAFSKVRLLPELTISTCINGVPVRLIDRKLVRHPSDIKFVGFQGSGGQCVAGGQYVAVLNTKWLSVKAFEKLSAEASFKDIQNTLQQNFSSFASIVSSENCAPTLQSTQVLRPMPGSNATRSLAAGVVPIACMELQRSSDSKGLFPQFQSSILQREAARYDQVIALAGSCTGLVAFVLSLVTSSTTFGRKYSKQQMHRQATLWTCMVVFVLVWLWPALYSWHWGSSLSQVAAEGNALLGGANTIDLTFLGSFLPLHLVSMACYCILVPCSDLFRVCWYICVKVPCGSLVEGSRLRQQAWRGPELNAPLWNSCALLLMFSLSTVGAVVPSVSLLLLVYSAYWAVCLKLAVSCGLRFNSSQTSCLASLRRVACVICPSSRLLCSFSVYTAPELRFLGFGGGLFGMPDAASSLLAQVLQPLEGSNYELVSRLTAVYFSVLVLCLAGCAIARVLHALAQLTSTALRTCTAQAWTTAILQACCRPCTHSQERNIASSRFIGEHAECVMMQAAAQDSTPELFSAFFVPPTRFTPRALRTFGTPRHLRPKAWQCIRAPFVPLRALQIGWQVASSPLELGDSVPVRRLMWTESLVKGCSIEQHAGCTPSTGKYMSMYELISQSNAGSYSSHATHAYGELLYLAAALREGTTKSNRVDMLELRRSLNDLREAHVSFLQQKRLCQSLLWNGMLQDPSSSLAEMSPHAQMTRTIGCIKVAPIESAIDKQRRFTKIAKQDIQAGEYADAMQFSSEQTAQSEQARTDWSQQKAKVRPNSIVEVTGGSKVLNIVHHIGWEAPAGVQARPFSQEWVLSERQLNEEKWEKTKERMKAGLAPKASPRMVGSHPLESKQSASAELEPRPALTSPTRIDVRPASSHAPPSERRVLTAPHITVVGSSRALQTASSSRSASRPGTSEVVEQLHQNRALWVRKGIEKGIASGELAKLSEQIKHDVHGKETMVPETQLHANGSVDWHGTAALARMKSSLMKAAGHGQVQLQPASGSDQITAGGYELLLSGGASQAQVGVQQLVTGDMKVLRVESSIKVYQSSMKDAVQLEHEIQRRMRLATSGRKQAWRQSEFIGDAGVIAASPANIARAAKVDYGTLRTHSKQSQAKYAGQAFDNYVNLG